MKFIKTVLPLALALALALSPVLAMSVFAETNSGTAAQVNANANARAGFGKSIWKFFGGKDNPNKDKDRESDDSDDDKEDNSVFLNISAEDRTRFCDNKSWLARILPPGIYKNLDRRLCGTPSPAPTPSTPDTTAPVISNVTVTDISATKVNIRWDTNERATSDVAYGLTNAHGNMITHYGLLRAHKVEVKGLAANTTYHFRVISKDAAGNSSTSADMTFTTNTSADTVAPVISDVRVSAVSSLGAAITWKTDEPASGRVSYGLTASYGASITAPGNGESHAVLITGLSGLTTYHYRVVSTDASGNTSASADATFTTLLP